MEPGILAKVAGHEEGKLMCKQEIPNHLSCFLFYQDEHAHWHNELFPCGNNILYYIKQSLDIAKKVLAQ